MIGRFSFLTLAIVMSAGQPVLARETPAGWDSSERSERQGATHDQWQLAQYREVEVFYDRDGREILLDPYTGEVVAVREPAPRYRQGREPYYEPPRGGYYEPSYRDDGYYDDDYYYEEPWDDRAARRDERRQDLGRAPQPEWQEPARDGGSRSAGLGGEPGAVERQPLEEAPAGETPREDTAGLTIPDVLDGGSIIDLDPAPAQGQGPGQGARQADQPTAEIDFSGDSEQVARFQILLGRVGASPGVIDGKIGDNVNKAITAYRDITGDRLRTYDQTFIDEQLQATGGDAFITYEITPEDVAGPYVASIPEDYGEKSRMEHMGYTSVTEALAEKFHMDERYLIRLNPDVNFDRPGTRIKVANVGPPLTGKVTRIVADKGQKQVRAYGENGKLIAVYPATIGSQSTPSPTGSHTVERIALDPEYTYNPKINFQQGDNDRVLTIPPGPNGPVGNVWIALSKPTYGIHGTPEPSQIGRTYSNGCIRLTNWDARELAGMVEKGTTVEFRE